MPPFFLPMLTDEIAAWLKAPDEYAYGLDLLRETGFSSFTLTILSMGDDAYNRARLEKELQSCLQKQNDVLPIGPVLATEATRLTEQNSVIEFIMAPRPETAQPAAVDQLQQQIYALMDERTECRAWIRAKEALGNSEAACAERLPKALRIKVITRQIDELYSHLDFFEQHGYLPASDPGIVADDTVLLNNVRTYVSKYKGKLKKKNLTPEQRQKFEQLLREYQDEKNRLETKLNKHHDPDSPRQQTPDRPVDSAPFPPP